MAIYDISRTLQPALAVWPGDTPFALVTELSMAAGEPVNLTTMTLSAHTGTHMDAPRHFVADGAAVAELDLAPFWGLAQVVQVAKTAGALTPDDLAHVDPTAAPRLLVQSAASWLDPAEFPPAYVYPHPELAAWLAAAGVVLFGSDAPSMDPVDSQDLPGHRALAAHGIAILEWLNLRDVPPGRYELVALPLKIAAGDGSPVRAALRRLDP